MPLTDAQKARVRAAAEAAGRDPDKAVARAEAKRASAGPAPERKTPEPGAPAGGGSLPESVRMGYYAYQFPVLTVNEIRASLGQGPAKDGELYYEEWIKKHGGGGGTPTGEGS